VASIDNNTRQISINSEDLLTINANVQNTESEILKLSSKNQNLEKSSKSYFENVEIWTKETFDSIKQIQQHIPEVFSIFIFSEKFTFFRINFHNKFTLN
jgi:hypothetical protein